jgi:hypothetical protein
MTRSARYAGTNLDPGAQAVLSEALLWQAAIQALEAWPENVEEMVSATAARAHERGDLAGAAIWESVGQCVQVIRLRQNSAHLLH